MDFEVEFYAYNFSKYKIVKKIYVLAPNKNNNNIEHITLNEHQLKMLSRALGSNALASFKSERYSLFDISFREDGIADSIGLSFNDRFDYDYIKPSQVFDQFKNLDLSSFVKTVAEIQNNMFKQGVGYNPIFMIGMVIDDTELKSIKAYIRYDLKEAPAKKNRRDMMESIAKTINVSYSPTSQFSEITEKLECLNLKFSFVGIDCNSDKTKRYKVYFRAYEFVDSNMVLNELKSLISLFGIKDDAQRIIKGHEKGIWGVAISTDSFEYVDGVQLYCYP